MVCEFDSEFLSPVCGHGTYLRGERCVRETAEGDEVTAEQLAALFGLSERTARRHVAILAALGAPGIRRAKPEGSRRWMWLVSESLVDQWKRGEIPAPWASALRSVAR